MCVCGPGGYLKKAKILRFLKYFLHIAAEGSFRAALFEKD